MTDTLKDFDGWDDSHQMDALASIVASRVRDTITSPTKAGAEAQHAELQALHARLRSFTTRAVLHGTLSQDERDPIMQAYRLGQMTMALTVAGTEASKRISDDALPTAQQSAELLGVLARRAEATVAELRTALGGGGLLDAEIEQRLTRLMELGVVDARAKWGEKVATEAWFLTPAGEAITRSFIRQETA